MEFIHIYDLSIYKIYGIRHSHVLFFNIYKSSVSCSRLCGTLVTVAFGYAITQALNSVLRTSAGC